MSLSLKFWQAGYRCIVQNTEMYCLLQQLQNCCFIDWLYDTSTQSYAKWLQDLTSPVKNSCHFTSSKLLLQKKVFSYWTNTFQQSNSSFVKKFLSSFILTVVTTRLLKYWNIYLSKSQLQGLCLTKSSSEGYYQFIEHKP